MRARRLALLACVVSLTAPAAVTQAADGGFVTGTVFQDVNADGAGPQAGEAGLAGWVVSTTAGGPTATVGADGSYTLGPLAPGPYTVQVQPPGAPCGEGAVCSREATVQPGASARLDFPVVITGSDPGRILLDEGGLKVGAVRLKVPSGCRKRPFKAAVTGNGVTRVDFRVDGRTLRSVRQADRAGRFTATIDPRALRRGRHRVAAAVFFGRGSATPGKRIAGTFRSCAGG